MNLSEDIERIKEVMGIRKPEVVRKGEFTNKYGEKITMALFDDGEVYFKHSDYGNEFFPLKSLIRKDIEGNSMFMINLHQEEKDFVNNFIRDTKYQNESYNPIITESRDVFFKRRQDEFLDVLLTSFEWMDEFIEEMGSFEDYLKLILKHSIDAFFEFNEILVTIDEIEELLPIAFKSLRNDERLFRHIKEHYYSKKPNTTITESKNRFSMLNESKEMAIVKRRIEKLYDYIIDRAHWLVPSRFRDFEEYLRRVIFSATRDFIANEIGGRYQDQDELREELDSMILELIMDHPIYDEIYDYYLKNI